MSGYPLFGPLFMTPERRRTNFLIRFSNRLIVIAAHVLEHFRIAICMTLEFWSLMLQYYHCLLLGNSVTSIAGLGGLFLLCSPAGGFEGF